ncbi:MAG: methyltransferase domain-containing protein [Planctomycetes bacterium]|nr:methyltransferase domain-containing protein [Planctomycetota bacterium]MCB9917002.1 methyltransferase domain-containing protein [Planctomycetota bacterium]
MTCLTIRPKHRREDSTRLLTELLRCVKCHAPLEHVVTLETVAFDCLQCASRYPIIDGIPRFVSAEFIRRDEHNDELARKTKNYFGFEWDHFRDWGFLPDTPSGVDPNTSGGTVSDRQRAFQSKCRLNEDDLGRDKVVLDAGCGNGRYTLEAALRGPRLVIGVDLGYGAVTSARDNTQQHDNVVIIQADLHDLPFRDDVIDSCFSNGVLMHTGDAERAFGEIARTIRPGGVFVAHVYQKLHTIWEHNDRHIRDFTTKLSIEEGLEFARLMAQLARFLDRFEGVLPRANDYLRLQVTEHHMFDWYSAPTASHHTYAELAAWFDAHAFSLLDELPSHPDQPTGEWACNLKGRKR